MHAPSPSSMGQSAASKSNTASSEKIEKTSSETVSTTDDTVSKSPAASIGNGPEAREPMSRARMAVQPRKGSTFIPLDDDMDDEPSNGFSDKAPAGDNSYPFAELVQNAAELDKQRQRNLESATEILRKFKPGFERAVVSKINVYHHPRRGSRHLIVVDDAIPVRFVGSLFESLLRDGFRRTEFARPDTRQYKHHIVEYNPEELREFAITQIVSSIVNLCFPRPTAEPLEMYRIYTNAVLFGDVAFMHRDSDSDDHITALLYPNLEPEWRAELGGETVFYDEDLEVIDAVEPRAGRLCIFTGSLLHKGSPPGRLVYESRFTTAFKFSPVERQPSERPPRARQQHVLNRPQGGNDPEPQ